MIQWVRRWRYSSQVVFLILFAAIPLSGLFRIDLFDHHLLIAGRSFSLNQLYLAVILFAASVVGLALLARNFSRFFCGWFCFQTFWSEWGGRILSDWKRFKTGRNRHYRMLARVVFRLMLAWLMMLVFYSILISWFVSPSVLLSWLQYGAPIWFYVLFAKFSTFGLLDMLIIRHSFCQTICPYGILQQKLKKNSALRVGFNPKHCIDCSLCDRACPMRLKPRELTTSDPCISCVECIVACGVKAQKLAMQGPVKGSTNSLFFTFRPHDPASPRLSFADLKTVGLGVAVLAFMALLIAGIRLDDGVDMKLTREDDRTNSYTLIVTNRTDKPIRLVSHVAVTAVSSSERLAAESAAFRMNPVHIEMEALRRRRMAVELVPDRELSQGRYTLLLSFTDSIGQEVEKLKSVYYKKQGGTGE